MSESWSCPMCQGATPKAYTLCANCQSQKKQLQSQSQRPARTVSPWVIETNEKKTLQKSRISTFTSSVDDLAELIATDAAGNIGSSKATDFSGQYTVHDFGSTITLDFQGVRQGGNTCWLDYQGQVGGGSTKRKSYFQVMIQCGGEVPAQGVIEDAIRRSHGTGSRSVIFRNTTDRPN